MVFTKKRNNYKVGDTKTVEKFAFFPIKINPETIIWLERYFSKYEVREERYLNQWGISSKLYWQEIERSI